MFGAYIGVSVYQIKNHPGDVAVSEEVEVSKEENSSLLKDIFLLIIGAALIAWGANLLVNNGTIIARELGVPESVIALTFVALGTSLPELVTAITSLTKGHGAPFPWKCNRRKPFQPGTGNWCFRNLISI